MGNSGRDQSGDQDVGRSMEIDVGYEIRLGVGRPGRALLVPQRLHRFEVGRPLGRVEAEEQSDCSRKERRQQNGIHAHHRVDIGVRGSGNRPTSWESAQPRPIPISPPKTLNSAEFGQELEQDVPLARTDRFPQADLARVARSQKPA